MKKKPFLIVLAIIAAIGVGYFFGVQKPIPDSVKSTATISFRPAAVPDATESPNATYVYNRNSHKFHYPHCSSVNDMSYNNKVYWYDSRSELLKKYPSAVPCKRCNP
jgi:hypothetical protein